MLILIFLAHVLALAAPAVVLCAAAALIKPVFSGKGILQGIMIGVAAYYLFRRNHGAKENTNDNFPAEQDASPAVIAKPACKK